MGFKLIEMNCFSEKIIWLSMVIFLACADQTNDVVGGVQAVVAGYIFAGYPIDSLRITTSNSYNGDGILQTLDDLTVTVKSSELDFHLTPIGDGYYENSEVVIKEGTNYELVFELNHEMVRAETFVPNVTEVDISDSLIYREEITTFRPGGFGADLANIELTWLNPSGDYFFILVENIEQDPDYIIPAIQDFRNSDDAPERPIIRTEPEITDFYAINNFRDIQQFGRHRVVIYRLNAEYAALYQTVGASSLSITSPPTNIENGLGIFTGISTDTVYFTVRKI